MTPVCGRRQLRRARAERIEQAWLSPQTSDSVLCPVNPERATGGAAPLARTFSSLTALSASRPAKLAGKSASNGAPAMPMRVVSSVGTGRDMNV